MRIVVLDPAEIDLADLRSYYERQREGLGDEFIDDFHESVARIRQFPRRYAVFCSFYRLCPIKRFKVGVYYHVGTIVFIDAVIDLRRGRRFVMRRLRF